MPSCLRILGDSPMPDNRTRTRRVLTRDRAARRMATAPTVSLARGVSHAYRIRCLSGGLLIASCRQLPYGLGLLASRSLWNRRSDGYRVLLCVSTGGDDASRLVLFLGAKPCCPRRG